MMLRQCSSDARPVIMHQHRVNLCAFVGISSNHIYEALIALLGWFQSKEFVFFYLCSLTPLWIPMHLSCISIMCIKEQGVDVTGLHMEHYKTCVFFVVAGSAACCTGRDAAGCLQRLPADSTEGPGAHPELHTDIPPEYSHESG